MMKGGIGFLKPSVVQGSTYLELNHVGVLSSGQKFEKWDIYRVLTSFPIDSLVFARGK